MTLLQPTRLCKLCFKEIRSFSLKSFAKPQFSLCDECAKKLNPKFKKFEISHIDCLSVYEYDENLKSLIYQFKGCYDYELKSIFLSRYLAELKIMFSDYEIVPIPSNKDDDALRGFNHVEEVFKELNLKMIKCISKTEKIKQSDRNSEERKEIEKYLKFDEKVNLDGKKLLIVDDICTTGSTLKAAIKLLESKHPKCIKVLVLCKTKDLEAPRKF